MNIVLSPYWFKLQQIKLLEDNYAAKYMGAWSIWNTDKWSAKPVEVFHAPLKGKYIGLFLEGRDLRYTLADSAFKEDIYGMESEKNVYISRFKDDRISFQGKYISGGRDFVDSNAQPLVQLEVINGNFYSKGNLLEEMIVEHIGS